MTVEGEGLILENIPERVLGRPCIIGIDEAGRGPVLGPLVYAIFVCPIDDEGLLKDLQAGDSKDKTLDERECFYEKLKTVMDRLGWKVKVLHPEEISNCMLRREKYNLNTLSYETVYGLIRTLLAKNINIVKGFVDTLGPADKYETRLTDLFPGIKFTVRSKADSLFPVVGAASIVAKVTRDRTLRAWFGDAECGCGYPSDPKTVAWLKANMDPVFGFSNLVRFSWSSCERLLEADGVKFEWHSEKPDEARKIVRHTPSLITAPLKPSSNW